METTLKYTLIKNEAQYDKYCNALEKMVFSANREIFEDDIDLLTMLIEKWDDEHYKIADIDPVQLLESIMEDHELKSVDLAKILDVSPLLISDILNYKIGFPKKVIIKLSAHFKLRHEAFNTPYELKNHPLNKSLKKNSAAAVMNNIKDVGQQ